MWHPGSARTRAAKPRHWYIEQARLAEEARFDLVFIVDSQFITADSPPHYLNRLEPVTLLSALAVATTHLGLVATMTTSYNDPFNIARRLASLDLISGGRSGWNVVTSSDAGTAVNFSRDEHFDYDTRYARGLEFVRVAQGLWDSYEADAFPRDRASRVFLDPSRQHALHHQGEHFQVAGPLNVSRSPQGQPVIFQVGDSEQGRDLGATIGEGIFTHAASVEQGQAFYNDLKGRAAAKGRDPEEIVIMPGVSVWVGDTDADARDIERDRQTRDRDFDRALAELGRPFAWHDFRQYELDAPFPQQALKYAERGFRTNAEQIARLAAEGGFTLRQTVEFILAPRPTRVRLHHLAWQPGPARPGEPPHRRPRARLGSARRLTLCAVAASARAQPSSRPVVLSTWPGISPSWRSPVVTVPVGSNIKIAPPGDDGLCSVPFGTTKMSPARSETVRSAPSSRSDTSKTPSRTRKNSSVSACTCHTCSPWAWAMRTS